MQERGTFLPGLNKWALTKGGFSSDWPLVVTWRLPLSSPVRSSRTPGMKTPGRRCLLQASKGRANTALNWLGTLQGTQKWSTAIYREDNSLFESGKISWLWIGINKPSVRLPIVTGACDLPEVRWTGTRAAWCPPLEVWTVDSRAMWLLAHLPLSLTHQNEIIIIALELIRKLIL